MMRDEPNFVELAADVDSLESEIGHVKTKIASEAVREEKSLQRTSCSSQPRQIAEEVVLPETGDSESQLCAQSRTRAISHLAAAHSGPQSSQLFLSTALSLGIVLVLMISVRVVVPPLVESIRYSWSRGQLRAEYEMSGQRLNNVSLKSLTEVSKLVSQRTGPSVVHINLKAEPEPLATKELSPAPKSLTSPFDQFGPGNGLLGQGSGFIIDTQGHIVTNHHVVDGVGKFEVSLSDGRVVEAKLVQFDSLTDLAILKIDADGLMPITWGNSDELEVGSPVWAVGSPYGLDQSVTFGILSGKHRINLKGTRYDSRLLGSPAYGDLMQSDVAVNPGNSGGPLVNALGEIIGVNTAIVGEHYRGISFSIPSNVAREVAENLIRDGHVSRGFLGVGLRDVTEEDIAAAGIKNLRGAVVARFHDDPQIVSPAKAAGILPGDIIVKIDAHKINSSGELMVLVGRAAIDSIVKIEIVRAGKAMVLDVKIGRRP